MDFFDLALQLEADSEKYYREQARKTKYHNLKTVMEALADDERRHYKIVEALREQNYKDLGGEISLGEESALFLSYKDDAAALRKEISIEKLKEEQIDVYRLALVKEQESVDLYQKMSDQAKNQEEKLVLDKLIKEEEGHVAVFDSIVDMLNHVNDWVESAEFNNKDNY